MGSGKTLRAFILFACVAVLSLGLGACKEEPVDQPEEANVPADVDVPQDVDVGIEPGETSPETPEDDQPAISAPADGPADIVPLVGVGSVTFGMTKEQVIEEMGEPDKTEAGGVALFYPQSYGLSLVLEYRGGVQEIHCWSDQHPMKPPDMGLKTYPGKTAEGIGMGSSRDDIVAAFGQPDSTTSKGPIETLAYDNLKASFELVEDKLARVRLRAPSQ